MIEEMKELEKEIGNESEIESGKESENGIGKEKRKEN